VTAVAAVAVAVDGTDVVGIVAAAAAVAGHMLVGCAGWKTRQTDQSSL
jgi:hypothetical protein